MIICIIFKKYKRWICYKRNLEVWGKRANQNQVFAQLLKKTIWWKYGKYELAAQLMIYLTKTPQFNQEKSHNEH